MNRKYIFAIGMLVVILAVCIVFTGIFMNQNNREKKEELTIVTSFYPMYVAALNVVGDTDGVTLENLSEPQTGCLHDYQLTPGDMKLLSRADVFVINGGGIESFLSDVAQEYPSLTIVEACSNLTLLTEDEETQELHSEEEHDHGSENAHAWMSVKSYRQQVATITESLCQADPAHGDAYKENAAAYDEKLEALQKEQQDIMEAAAGRNVIIFHEAYAYIAQDYGMNISYVLDLDEERQVSAGEVADVLAVIQENDISYVFAEELYGRSMGDTVEAESEVKVLYLDALNRGDYDADSYLTGMKSNMEILREAFCK